MSRNANYPKLTECVRIPAPNGYYDTPNARETRTRADFSAHMVSYKDYIDTTYTVHCTVIEARKNRVHFGKECEYCEFQHKYIVGAVRQKDYIGRATGGDFRKKSQFNGETYIYEVKCNASDCGYYDPVNRVFTYDPENADFIVYCPRYNADMSIDELLDNSYIIPVELFFEFNYNRPKNAFHEIPERHCYQVTRPWSSVKNWNEWTEFLNQFETARAHYTKHGYIK